MPTAAETRDYSELDSDHLVSLVEIANIVGPDWLDQLDIGFAKSIKAVKSGIRSGNLRLDPCGNIEGRIRLTLPDEAVRLTWVLQEKKHTSKLIIKTLRPEQEHETSSVWRALFMNRVRRTI